MNIKEIEGLEDYLKIFSLGEKTDNFLNYKFPAQLESSTAGNDFYSLIKEEINNQLRPIKKTQNVLIDQVASLSLDQDELKEQIENISQIFSENNRLKKFRSNVEKIISFKDLKYNWNDNNAEPFENIIIDRALFFITSDLLKYQPEIFPTARHSIQLEYEKANGDYLEIEIFRDFYLIYSEVTNREFESKTESFKIAIQSINDFYSRL